tara:strand:- start:545 stop:922 length:378 start_codon:yes stop_codon:yes gene_type:complete
MSNPNIAKLGTLQALNLNFKCEGLDPNLLLATQSSQTVKLNSLYITNNNACSKHSAISLYINDGTRSDSISNFHLAKNIVVPLQTTIILIDKESVVYLKPSSFLYIVDHLGSSIEGVLSYDIMQE